MAIAKMQKISLVTRMEQKDLLIQVIQGLQSVEIAQLDVKDQVVSHNQPHKRANDYAEAQDWYKRGEQALVILSRHVKMQPLLNRFTSQRPELTMRDLLMSVDILRAKKLITTIEYLSRERNFVIEQRRKVSQAQSEIQRWYHLSVDPHPMVLSDTKHFDIRLGYVPNVEGRTYLDAIKNKDYLAVQEISETDEYHAIAVVIDSTLSQQADEDLRINHFEEWKYPYMDPPKEVFDALESHRLWLNKREEEIIANIRRIDVNRSELELAIEAFYNSSQRALVEEYSQDNAYLTYIQGWLNVEHLDLLEEALDNDLEATSYALIKEEITEEEIDNDEVPIQLVNNAIVKPFEPITLMYSTPNYREKDPTPYVMPFYMLFFGMMMGDFGYGLVLLILTSLALKFVDLSESMHNTMRMGQLLSLSTMVVGLAYGSMFGESLPFGLIDPLTQAMELMIIAMSFGFVHMVVALLIKTQTEWQRKSYESMYSDGAGWLLIFLGFILLGVAYYIDNPVLMSAGKWLAILSAVGLVIAPMFTNENRLAGLAMGIYNLYGASGYIGDFISYSRLMAIGLSGGSIAMAINMIVGMMPAGAKFTFGILILLGVHAFNIFLSILSAYVHGLRLVFVEFFGKFFEGGGKIFKPVNTLQKYIRLTDVRNVEE